MRALKALIICVNVRKHSLHCCVEVHMLCAGPDMRWDTQSAAVHGDVGSQMLTAMQWNASNWMQVLSMCAPQCPMLEQRQ